MDAGLEEAEKLFRRGKHDEALEKISGLVPKIKESHQANFLRGKIYAAKNNTRAAIACFAAAHSSVPTEFNYGLEYAISLYNDNQKQEASQVFRTCRKLDPLNQTVKNYLSLLTRQFPDSRGGTGVSTSQPVASPYSAPIPPPNPIPPGGAKPGAVYGVTRPPSGGGAYGVTQPPSGGGAYGVTRPPSGGGAYGVTRPPSGGGAYGVTQPPSGGGAYGVTRPPSGGGAYGVTRPPSGGGAYGVTRPPSGGGAYGVTRPPSGGGAYGVTRPPSGGGAYTSGPYNPGTAKKEKIANLFGSGLTETRGERAKRLRELDLDNNTTNEVIDFNDPKFWEEYNKYNVKPGEHYSEAERSGDVHISGQDFSHLHHDEYEKELELKKKQPILNPYTGWLVTNVIWGAGSFYVGDSGGGFRKLLLQLVFIAMLFGAWYEANNPFYTDEFARNFHGRQIATKMIVKDKMVFINRRSMITQTSWITLVILALIYLMVQSRYAKAVSRKAKEINFSYGLLIEVAQNLDLEINLGSLHGIHSRSRIIIEKRSFVPRFDEKSGTESMVGVFARIGRCQIKDIFETTTFCAYKPEQGQIVIPKVGDRVTVLPEE